jgi:hypothetical protein
VIITRRNRIFSNHEKIEFRTGKLTTILDLQHNARGYVAACNLTGKIPRTRRRATGYNLLRSQLGYKCNLGAHEALDGRFEACLPLLIRSLYAKQGLDSQVHSEHGGIAVDFLQRPRKFVPIRAPRKENFYERQSIYQRLPHAELNPQ